MNAYIQMMSFLLSVYIRMFATAMMLFVLWMLFGSPTSPAPEHGLETDVIKYAEPQLHNGDYEWSA